MRHFLFCCLLVFLTALPFAQVVSHDFLTYDDPINVYDNPNYNPITATGLGRFWQRPYFSLYTPITYDLWGGVAATSQLPKPIATSSAGPYRFNPSKFHLLNLVLQIANVLLVHALLRTLRASQWAAAAGALLFGLHPLQVEPVAWVTGMNNLLSGCFALIALQLHLNGVQAEVDGKATARRRMRFLATCSFSIALLAKPTVIVLPLMAMALDCWLTRRPLRSALRSVAWWILPAVVALAVTQWAQATGPVVAAPSLPGRLLVAGDAIAFYTSKLLLPIHLIPQYGRSPDYVLSQTSSDLYAGLAFAMIALLWFQRRQHATLFAGVAVALAGLLPTLGLVPHYFQSFSTVADRYCYLALFGIAFLISQWLTTRAGKPAWVVLMIYLAALACLTTAQTARWATTQSLFDYTLTVNPRSYVALTQLALCDDRAGRTADAIGGYRRALEINPNYPVAQNNLGLALGRSGHIAEAIRVFSDLVQHEPGNAEGHVNFATALARNGQAAEAIEQLQQALALQPESSAVVSLELGMLLNQTGRAHEAENVLHDVAARNPNNAALRNQLGLAFARQDKMPEAIGALAEAVRLAPQSAEYRFNYGVALIQQGDRAGAIAAWKEALRIDTTNELARKALARATRNK